MRGNELLNAMQLVDAKYVNAVDHSIPAKRHFLKRSLALVACLCFLLVASYLIASPRENTFAVIAYAAETEQDGSVTLCEADLLTSSSALGGYYDGQIMYLGLGLQCRGNNLKSVTFKATDGVFATQHKSAFSDMHPLDNMPIGENEILILPYTAFENSGKILTLDSETSTDVLVFWGNTPEKLPEKLTIHATAIFVDGQTQNVEIPIDLSNNPIVTAMDKEALPYLYFSFSLSEKEDNSNNVK